MRMPGDRETSGKMSLPERIITPFMAGRNRKVVFMNEWYAQAKSKLEDGKKSGKFDRYAGAMKNAVCEALDGFCKQDKEFAQAVVQGGSFENCMRVVAKNCGSAISDLEAFRRAVRFYFPGADVRFQMSVNLCASVEVEESGQLDQLDQAPKNECKILALEDFL